MSYQVSVEQNIICCDYENKCLALGTGAGIYILDVNGQLTKVGNYSLPVSQIRFVNHELFALILNSPLGAQPRYIDGELVFALVKIRLSDKQIVAEAENLCCHGCFGTSDSGQIQVVGSPDSLVTFDSNL